MRSGWAAPIVIFVAMSSAWGASACGAFTASDDPVDGTTDGALIEGGGGQDGNAGADGGDGGAGAGPGRIYVVAGEPAEPGDGGAAPYTDSVIFATQQAGGALGPWTVTERAATLHGNTTVATAAGLLNLGGELQTPFNASATSATSRALVNSTGTVSDWLPTTPLTVARFFHAAVVVNGYVVVIGGSAIGLPPLATVQTARIEQNGSVSSWKEVAPLPQGRTRVAAATDGTHVFVVGGLGDNASCTFDVLVGTIDANGDIPTWASSGVQYSFRSAAAVVFQQKLYAIGGYRCTPVGVSKTVQIADIKADGTLAPFQTGVDLPDNRWGHGAVVIGPHLYVLGGDDGTLRRPEVSRADLDGQGAYDSWKTDSQLPQERTLFGVTAR
jgi:hypothetical protein